MKKCLGCGRYNVKNPLFDYCRDCFEGIEISDEIIYPEQFFEIMLNSKEIPCVYIMLYGNGKRKIGYSRDFHRRMIDIKTKYPDNKLVFFRDFTRESDAPRFEVWLKRLEKKSDVAINKFISDFQNKLHRVERL